MLQIENLSVSYGSVRALSDVDLEVLGDGILHGVIGPNGAGKSTLLDAVCGRRRPIAGTVRYRNEDITRRSVAWRRRQGMARSFQRTSIFQDLTVHEQLHLVAQHLGDNRLDDVIEVMDLTGYLHQKAGRIAYGVQRRVDVALLGNNDRNEPFVLNCLERVHQRAARAHATLANLTVAKST